MVNVTRFLKHLFTVPCLVVGRHLTSLEIKKLEDQIAASELTHGGEIVIVVEHALPLSYLYNSRTPRDRAVELFSTYKLWDTAHNSGALIYVQLTDRSFEIIVDRGLHQVVTAAGVTEIARVVEGFLKERKFFEGLSFAIKELTYTLATHFPPVKDDVNELSNRVIVL